MSYPWPEALKVFALKENIRDIKADAMVISSLVEESNGGLNPTDQPGR